MFGNDASCSECKLEVIQARWTQILINWINTCISPNARITKLNPKSLIKIADKYKHDICSNDNDMALLMSDDLEPFLAKKFPILRLRYDRYFTDIGDLPRKICLMTSALMFYCCISSKSGVVVADICEHMAKKEQELILLFCEKLSDMEITVNNIETAVTKACEEIPGVPSVINEPKESSIEEVLKPRSESFEPSDSFFTSESDYQDELKQQKHHSNLRFKSSMTVMPSRIDRPSDPSSYSAQQTSSFFSSPCSDNTMSSKIGNGTSDSDINTAVNNAESISTSPYSNSGDDIKKGVGIQELKSRSVGVSERPLMGLRRGAPVATQNTYVSTRHANAAHADEHLKLDCACSGCSLNAPCCVTPVKCDGDKMHSGRKPEHLVEFEQNDTSISWKIWTVFVVVVIATAILTFIVAYFVINNTKNENLQTVTKLRENPRMTRSHSHNGWQCQNNFCKKTNSPDLDTFTFPSLSQCTLLCTGPQIWPQPIGYTYFSKTLVALATSKLEYKFKSVPSEIVHQYLGEAFKLFLGDLAKLERMGKRKYQLDFDVKKMNIQIDVETDSDPRLKMNTDETYHIRIESALSYVKIYISSASFCGVRHGLETLSQLIHLDEDSGYLITLSHAVIKDSPSHKYRGLMIDTGRNYIPVSNILSVIDAMASCKLNTFHWRISDSTSFPFLIYQIPKLFENGAFDRAMSYKRDDIKSIVKRAGVRGIRVLIEVASPGPVGRPWAWSSDATCKKKSDNVTCDNILCTYLKMQKTTFQSLQQIYAEILTLTGVEDIFHLSDSIFSLHNCYGLLSERSGFLVKALDSLKAANKGFLPKLPIIWYTPHLKESFEMRTWDRLGVQIGSWTPLEWQHDLTNYRVIHSSKWDLSCEIGKNRCSKYATWQQMYAWRAWRNVDAFTIEGGESMLWTDRVDASNLDYQLWPRAAAVAERLWSDMVANKTATGGTYVRLDHHRTRLLLKGIDARPIWPQMCTINPSVCLQKIGL